MRAASSLKNPILLCALLAASANAQINRWVDENGQVHYEDAPVESSLEVDDISSDANELESSDLTSIPVPEVNPLPDSEPFTEVDPLGDATVHAEIAPLGDAIPYEEIDLLGEPIAVTEVSPLAEPESFAEIAPLYPEEVIEEEAELPNDVVLEEPSAADTTQVEPDVPEPFGSEEAMVASTVDIALCQQVEQDLLFFSENARVRIIDPVTQERTVLTDEQRMEELQRLNQTQAMVCP